MQIKTRGVTTIEGLIIVGVIGILAFTGLKSYRSYLVTLENKLSVIDFDQTIDVLDSEFSRLEIEMISETVDLKSTSLTLDTSREWLDLVKNKISLHTDNVTIEIVEGAIATDDLILSVGLRAQTSVSGRNRTLCWDISSPKC